MHLNCALELTTSKISFTGFTSGSIAESEREYTAKCHDHRFHERTSSERIENEVLGVGVFADSFPYQPGRCKGKPPLRLL